MTAEHPATIGYVTSRGGPLLLADLDAAKGWTGAPDNARAVTALNRVGKPPGAFVTVARAKAFVWDVVEGTAEVRRDHDTGDLHLVSVLFEEDAAPPDPQRLPPFAPQSVGPLAVPSGWLVIFYGLAWSGDIDLPPAADGCRVDTPWGDDAALIVQVPPGMLSLDFDQVELAEGFVMRLRLAPSGAVVPTAMPRRRTTAPPIDARAAASIPPESTTLAAAEPDAPSLELGLFPDPVPTTDETSDDAVPRVPGIADSADGRSHAQNEDEPLGIVTSEGGPILIMDLRLAPNWSGIEDPATRPPPSEIDSAEPPHGHLVSLRDGYAFLWNVPAGAVEVRVHDEGEVVLTTGPIDQPWTQLTSHGAIELPTGWLLVLWAAEPGAQIDAGNAVDSQEWDLSMSRTALTLTVPAGRYLVETDETTPGDAYTRRCRLRAEARPPL